MNDETYSFKIIVIDDEIDPAATPTPKPTLTKAPTPIPNNVSEEDGKSITVYVTKTGEKYHRSGCRYLSKSKIPIKLEDSIANYSPCSICDPPQ